MFEKFIIDTNINSFDEFSKSINFEDIAKGRQGAVLVNCKNDLVPIVRTTTIYKNSAQKFLPIHHDIIEKIKKITNINITFNNAMIEIYDSSYRTMGFHTDQALDLNDNSFICLFSCYKDTSECADTRKLQIKNKITNEFSEILLDNNSIVLFSTPNNQKHLHKIIPKSNTYISANKWLGITFRLSKTFIKFADDNVPYIHHSNKILRMANNNEKIDFYKHKAKENSSTQYAYPEIDYTISNSDMLPVID